MVYLLETSRNIRKWVFSGKIDMFILPKLSKLLNLSNFSINIQKLLFGEKWVFMKKWLKFFKIAKHGGFYLWLVPNEVIAWEFSKNSKLKFSPEENMDFLWNNKPWFLSKLLNMDSFSRKRFTWCFWLRLHQDVQHLAFFEKKMSFFFEKILASFQES